jgi:hypothetical protein
MHEAVLGLAHRYGWQGREAKISPGPNHLGKGYQQIRLTADGEYAQGDLKHHPIGVLGLICGIDGLPGLHPPGECRVESEVKGTISAERQAASNPLGTEIKLAPAPQAKTPTPQNKSGDRPFPEHATLADIWNAYPQLDGHAQDRVRVNLNNAVRGKDEMTGTINLGGKKVKWYAAQIVRDVMARETETHGK